MWARGVGDKCVWREEWNCFGSLEIVLMEEDEFGYEIDRQVFDGKRFRGPTDEVSGQV